MRAGLKPAICALPIDCATVVRWVSRLVSRSIFHTNRAGSSPAMTREKTELTPYFRGSQSKYRIAITRPATPQAQMTRRSLVCNPDPLNWKNDLTSASAKWRIGKILETRSNHAGGLLSGTKTFEMNRRGNTDALTMAGAASEVGITLVTATPSAQNAAAPTTRARRNAGSVVVGRVAP